MAPDEVFEAWSSGDFDRMLGVLGKKTNPIDRHFLLMSIVDIAYKSRHYSEMAAKCLEIAQLHLSEFSEIAPAIKRMAGGTMPAVTTFQRYATLLCERGEFERAIKVCETAVMYGLRDGTKAGFAARIDRIRAARAKRKTLRGAS